MPHDKDGRIYEWISARIHFGYVDLLDGFDYVFNGEETKMKPDELEETKSIREILDIIEEKRHNPDCRTCEGCKHLDEIKLRVFKKLKVLVSTLRSKTRKEDAEVVTEMDVLAINADWEDSDDIAIRVQEAIAEAILQKDEEERKK